MKFVTEIVTGDCPECSVRTMLVNIEFLQKQVEKATIDIEKLKDRQREFANGNGQKY